MLLGGRRERRPKGGLIRKAIRGISGGVGLASESVKAHKEGKSAQAAHEETGSSSTSIPQEQGYVNRSDDKFEAPAPGYAASSSQSATISEKHSEALGTTSEADQELEDEWDLDDAQDEIIAGPSTKLPDYAAGELEDAFLRSQPPPGYAEQMPLARLSLPVIIPQRRPKDRSRGFIRAYAPALGEVGIDQATWLAFLDNFQKSSAANPWLAAINMAGFATLAIPIPGVGLAAGYAIRQATKIAIELQGRERTSQFLQKINDEFFRPRGLFCLVMTWNPQSRHRVEQVNLSATITSRSNSSTGISGAASNFRSSDGKTYGDYSFPEAAPLVFPALDQLASQTNPDGVEKKKKMAQRMGFVANYWDKRATAQYAMTNPDNMLSNVPQEKFKSRYADPNSAASSGSLISFVSGGHLVPNPSSRGLVGGLISVAGQAMRGEKQGSGWSEYDKERYNKRMYDGKQRLIPRPIGGAYKRLVKQNVLYLMVVNLPTDEEMAAAATYD